LHKEGRTARGCVLVEAEIPEPNGLGLLKQLRACGNPIPVLLLVNQTTSAFRRRARQAGACGVFEKPLANGELVDQLQRIFGADCWGLDEAVCQAHRLADGTCIVIRPMQPGDRAIEQRFVSSLSLPSELRRFLYGLRELPAALLDDFRHIHCPDNVAFIAIVEDNGAELVIGVARYHPTTGESIEFVLALAEAWQGRGVGRLLLQRLMRCAESAGISRIEGRVLREYWDSENHGMLELARDFSFEVSIDPADSLVHLSKSCAPGKRASAGDG
jgi:acetyltransferase